MSELRRQLERAIAGGMVLAGRQVGISGTDAQVREAVAAVIVRDMVLAGEGDRVLDLATKVATASRDPGGKSGNGQGAGDALAGSLQRIGATDAQQSDGQQDATPAISTGYDDGTANSESVVALQSIPDGVRFRRQLPLIPGVRADD